MIGILDDLLRSNDHEIASHIFKNLVFEDAAFASEGYHQVHRVMMKMIKGSVRSPLMIKAMAKNNPKVASFIRNGLTKDFINEIIQGSHNGDLLSLIGYGLMADGFDPKSLRMIMDFLRYDTFDIAELLTNVATYLSKCPDDSRLKMLDGFMTQGLKSHSVLALFKFLGFREICEALTLKSHHPTYVKSLFEGGSSFAKEFSKILQEKADLPQEKLDIFKKLIGPNHGTYFTMIFSSLRDSIMSLEFHLHEIGEVISMILASHFSPNLDRVIFLEIIDTYPIHVIQSLFERVQYHVSNPSLDPSLDPSLNPNPKEKSLILIDMIHRLNWRTNLSFEDKRRIIELVVKSNSDEVVSQVIKKIKSMVDAYIKHDSHQGNEFLLRVFLIIARRSDLFLYEKCDLYATMKNTYEPPFLMKGLIEDHMNENKISDEDIVLLNLIMT